MEEGISMMNVKGVSSCSIGDSLVVTIRDVQCAMNLGELVDAIELRFPGEPLANIQIKFSYCREIVITKKN